MARYKHDTNQAEIVAALTAAGACVAILSNVGQGVPNLSIGWHGAIFLLELKNPDGRGNRLTQVECEFIES